MPETHPPKSRPRWASKLDPWVAKAANLLGRLLQRPSEDLLSQLTPRNSTPDEPSGVEAGRRALEAGQLAEALHLFSALLEVDPDAAWAWHGRGDALQLMGDPKGSLTAYQRAAELAPEVGLHHSGRANALASLNRDEEAAAARALALELDPSLTWISTLEAAEEPLSR